MSASPCVYLRTKSSKNISLNFLPDVRSAEELLHENKVETTTSFVKYYSYGVIYMIAMTALTGMQLISNERKNA